MDGEHVHWTDLSVPGLDALGDRVWAWAMSHHVPGQQGMITAAARLVSAWLPLHYGLAAGAVLLVARWLP